MAVNPNLLQGELNDGTNDDSTLKVEQLLAGFLRTLLEEAKDSEPQERSP